MKSDRYDSIIIGVGHNGLVCAAYLAKHGHSVLVLEASSTPGGLAARREFYPGFKASVAHSVNHFPQKVLRDLDLETHGFKPSTESLPTVGLSLDGNHAVLHEGTVSGVGENEINSYRKYSRLMQRFADTLKPFWLKTMPRVGINSLADLVTFAHIGLNVRRLGKKDMREFLRITALPTRDLMDEFFDNDVLKATLSWDGLVGSKLAPRSPNHAVLAMLYRLGGEYRGGAGALIEALQSAAGACGAEVRTASAVERILVQENDDGLVAHGVQLTNGDRIESERVISAVDPQRTFFNLVGVENLEIEFTNRIRRLRCAGYVAKLHLALSGLPQFTGLDKIDGRMIIAPDMDTIEFAYDDAKYGACSKQPVMEIVIPSMHDTSLAPAGQHVLSAHVMYAPYQLKGGWDESARDAFCERVIDTIARYAPDIRQQILHRDLLTPLDLERSCNVTGGHWHHTEFALDQALMMRPTYEAAQYSTPLPGLYLCGAGCHPGGDLTGGPGHNAAQEILR
ncbi:MAG: NAD(P)/FAD-dependent oxidoreductase [Gammaproteobacteria bacterium]